MKLPGKKATIAILAALAIIPSASYATASYLYKPVQKVEAPVKQVVVKEAPVAESTEPVDANQNADTQVVTEPVAPAPVATPPVAPVAPVAAEPTVLSTQEYGMKYLDLTSVPIYQGCFDRIINTWPERFTPEVRERNVKALRVWANVCSTGMTQGPGPAPLISIGYGVNGEFFDSDLAKSRW